MALETLLGRTLSMRGGGEGGRGGGLAQACRVQQRLRALGPLEGLALPVDKKRWRLSRVRPSSAPSHVVM